MEKFRALSEPISPGSTDAETEFLLFQILQAHKALDRAEMASDAQGSREAVERAIETYGSVKDLLPKLGLDSGQSARVREQLAALVARSRGRLDGK